MQSCISQARSRDFSQKALDAAICSNQKLLNRWYQVAGTPCHILLGFLFTFEGVSRKLLLMPREGTRYINWVVTWEQSFQNSQCLFSTNQCPERPLHPSGFLSRRPLLHQTWKFPAHRSIYNWIEYLCLWNSIFLYCTRLDIAIIQIFFIVTIPYYYLLKKPMQYLEAA